jgi:hypothetical protein
LLAAFVRAANAALVSFGFKRAVIASKRIGAARRDRKLSPTLQR